VKALIGGMFMKKALILLAVICLAFSQIVWAKPLSEKKQAIVKEEGTLRHQMDLMILSIADLDILTNRDKIADFEIFIQDANRILASIVRIRKIDSHNVYEPFLKKLEKPTKKLLHYSKLKDVKAMKYPEKIFNACFSCHQAHRTY